MLEVKKDFLFNFQKNKKVCFEFVNLNKFPLLFCYFLVCAFEWCPDCESLALMGRLWPGGGNAVPLAPLLERAFSIGERRE